MNCSKRSKRNLILIGFLSAWLWMSAYAQAPKTGSVVLRWLPAKTAAKYELQIASDRSFSNVLLKKTVNTTGYRWNHLPAQNAYWRVRGVDPNGRYGKWSTVEVIQALVVPPRLQSPKPGMLYQIDQPGSQIEIAWKPVKHAQAYLVQIAGDPKFRKILFKRQTDQTKMVFTPPVTGRYHWRVRSLFSQTTRSRHSQTRFFRIMPAAPKPLAPKPRKQFTIGKDLHFRWSKIPIANGYLFQIASDRAFENIVFKSYPGRVGISWTPENPGTYYFRVASLDALKYPGRHSIPRSFEVLPKADLPALASPVIDTPSSNQVFQPDQQFAESGLPTEFRWLGVAGAVAYELELSTSRQFDRDLITNRVMATQIQLTLPVDRSYYFRVRALESGDNQDRPGDWSELRAFEIQKPIESAKIQIVEPPMQPKPTVTRPSRFHLGACLGLVSNFGEVTTGRVDLEIGFHFNDYLELDLSGGYFTSEVSVSDSEGLQVDSRLHAIPIKLLLAAYLLSNPDFRIYLGGGLQLNLSYASLSLPSSPELTETAMQYGFVAATGAEKPLGPGRLYIEIDYSLSSTSSGLVEVNTGGLFAVVGYRWNLW